MEDSRNSTSNMTEHDRKMAAKLECITNDPEAYYAAARKTAYREEMRRALMPWRKRQVTPDW